MLDECDALLKSSRSQTDRARVYGEIDLTVKSLIDQVAPNRLRLFLFSATLELNEMLGRTFIWQHVKDDYVHAVIGERKINHQVLQRFVEIVRFYSFASFLHFENYALRVERLKQHFFVELAK